MEKGGHIIIPRGSDNIQWEKVVIPSFHVVHIYNGEKVVMPSFLVDHTQWKKVVIPSGTYTMRKGGDSIILRGSYNRKS